MDPSHVLVPLDGSPRAGDAVADALDTYDCRVTVLNVVTPVDTSMSEGVVVGTAEDRRAEAHGRAERLVSEASAPTATTDRRVDTVVETGDPADTVLSYVEEHDVDHVVMGGHGEDRHAVARRLFGTVATSVVGEAPVPVTVVR